MTIDELGFFDSHAGAFALYETLKNRIIKCFPETSIQVKKSQINFKNRYIFACVSFQRVLKKRDLPNPYIVLTLGLPYPLESPRVAVKTEPYPNRWTTHFVLGSVDEIDDELIAWLSEAYAYANAK